MIKILFVAPSSFPIDGPEAMVNAKHIKLLCDMGCKIDLVCRDIKRNTNYYPGKEKTTLFDKVNTINVVHCETRRNIQTLFRHIATFIKTGYVYKASDWSYKAICTCEKLLKENQYDYIFTKDYPSEIVGVYISKKYKLKWIPTWNDPYMWKKYPAPYGCGTDYKESFLRRRLIKDIGKYAMLNLFPSERLCNYMLGYMYKMDKAKCIIMPHILLNNFFKTKSNTNQNSKLRLIYAGSISKERNPEFTLRALRIFLDKNGEKEIELTFLGVNKEKQRQIGILIEKYNLKQHVKLLPPVSYTESLYIVSSFDICLIIEATCREGIFLPSKCIDYLQNKKPIMAISPENGVMNDLYKHKIIDYFANNEDVNDIEKKFELIYDDFRQNHFFKNKDLSAFSEINIIQLHKNRILL